MKKILAILLALLLSLALFCACTEQPPEPTDTSVSSETSSQTDTDQVGTTDTVTDTDPDSSDASTSGTNTEMQDSENLQSIGTLKIGDEIRGVIVDTMDEGKSALVALDGARVSATGVQQVVISIPSDSSIVFHTGVGISAAVESIACKSSLYRVTVSHLISVQPMSTHISYEAPKHYPDLWEYYVDVSGRDVGDLFKQEVVYLRLIGIDSSRYLFAKVPNYSKNEPLSLRANILVIGEFVNRANLVPGDYVRCVIRQSTYQNGTTIVVEGNDVRGCEKVTDQEEIYYYKGSLMYEESFIPGDHIGGTILSVDENGKFKIQVSQNYVEKFGEIAYVTLHEDYYIPHMSSGSLGAIIHNGVKKGDSYEIVASRMTLSVQEGKWEQLYVEIPKIHLFSFPENFPDLSGGVYEGDLKSYTMGIFDYFRVVKIEPKVIYLASHTTSKLKVDAAILGAYENTLKVGDVIKLLATNENLDLEAGIYIYKAEEVEYATPISDMEASHALIGEPLKPVIYLYPEEDTVCSVKVDLDGKLTCTYPDHGTEGWQNFIAKPDGTLIFPDGREYYCLYWEGKTAMDHDFSKGFCVKGSDTAEFLTQILAEIGLTPREANEFIIYWLPLMQNNEYNLITFQTDSYTSAARLEITPTPDSLLRVYMVYQPLDAPVEIEPQTFEPFERKGFTVVEWGGDLP